MGVYDQQVPQDPCLNFLDYLNNSEPLLDTDVVAWVTIGTHHLPTSEDRPTTATPGHRVNFLLQARGPAFSPGGALRAAGARGASTLRRLAGALAKMNGCSGSCGQGENSP